MLQHITAGPLPGRYAAAVIERSRLPSRWLAALAVVVAMISGCAGQPEHKDDREAAQYEQVNTLPAEQATVVAYSEREFNDPLISVNRAVFAFNDFSYRYLLIPAAKGYQQVVPSPVRSGVSNVFANIKSPISIVNHLLQGEPGRAGTTSVRLLINTTIGIVGLFDAADHWFDIPGRTTGFRDTLADYGSGYGIYLVLPLLGPSDLRGSTGLIADYFLNPIPYLTEQPDTSYLMASDAFQAFSDRAENYETLRAKSEDPYLFFRNMYLQGQLRDQQFPPEDATTEGAGP